ncbi:acyltransferase family protein [Asticcacaulis machinosus]|uniref:Acyltransferase family protein n=1 Tax=Asticcacaulis machinosus TaxID=2984211 RepID=A0ABT5HNC9_9CAUL|nr:acyltransferase family protein [Asticcacaulis machinosus]MDC7677732.1 acyltransferase family protein [Asticcacaulis machinosus]
MTDTLKTVDEGRYGALDAVRAGALMLGVALHATMSYTDPPFWIVQDAQRDNGFWIGFFVIHIFRMSLFFMLAGFFARLVFHKYGLKGFVANRFKRIALPLLIFWLPVIAAIITLAVMTSMKFAAAGGVVPPAPPPPTLATFPLTHLWFLYMLLVLYVGMLAVRGIVVLIDRKGALREGMGKVLGWGVKTGVAIPVLALPLVLVTAQADDWMRWIGIPTPDTGFVPNLMALTGFGVAFVFGWGLHRRADLLATLAQQWMLNLLAAVIFTTYCLWDMDATASFDKVAGRDHLLYAASYSLAIWTWSLGLIGLAMKTLSKPSQVWRFLSDSSYWVYIVHLPLVLGFQYLLMDQNWPAGAKFVAVVAGTLVIGWVSYRFGVRYTIIGTLLNGRKRAPHKLKQAAAHATN